MAYSVVGDLLTGKIPTPDYLDLQKIVDDAADEIDSKIGVVYTTPIDISENGPVSRPARLLLKRINNFIATGRLILAVASPTENSQIHAYGWYLIREATTAINAIVRGDIELTGATLIEVATEPDALPLIGNMDVESNVEAFYDRIGNPNYHYYPASPLSSPDRFVN